MRTTCTGCLATTLSNNYGIGFCPLGREQRRIGHEHVPVQECEPIKSQAELLSAMEEESE